MLFGFVRFGFVRSFFSLFFIFICILVCDGNIAIQSLRIFLLDSLILLFSLFFLRIRTNAHIWTYATFLLLPMFLCVCFSENKNRLWKKNVSTLLWLAFFSRDFFFVCVCVCIETRVCDAHSRRTCQRFPGSNMENCAELSKWVKLSNTSA